MAETIASLRLLLEEVRGDVKLVMQKLDDEIRALNNRMDLEARTAAQASSGALGEAQRAHKRIDDFKEDVDGRFAAAAKALQDNRRFVVSAIVIPLVVCILGALFYWLTAHYGTPTPHSTSVGLLA